MKYSNLVIHASRILFRILRREISAEDLVRMSSEELANDEIKRQNEDIRKNKLLECQRGLQQSATTDQYTCGRCKASESVLCLLGGWG